MSLNLFKKFSFTLLFLFSSLYAQQIKMTLRVDATDTPKHLLHTNESIEAGSGPVTLYFPRWIPGYHDPTGPVVDMAGLFIIAEGKTISWRRDPVVMNAIHCIVPEGTKTIDVKFDFRIRRIAKSLYGPVFYIRSEYALVTQI